MTVRGHIILAVGPRASTRPNLSIVSRPNGAEAVPSSMSGILRQVTAFGGKVVLGVMLLALLTPPFGLRAYLDARAQEQVQAAQVTHSFGRPVAAMVKTPVT